LALPFDEDAAPMPNRRTTSAPTSTARTQPTLASTARAASQRLNKAKKASVTEVAGAVEVTGAAESIIRATGDRLTRPRVLVLTYLMSLSRAASHADVLAALSAHKAMDRVTVYRVLEWLVDVGVAHRISGDDRVWRFMVNHAAPASTAKASAQVIKQGVAQKYTRVGQATKRGITPPHHQHAHFTCTACGLTFCLDTVGTSLDVKLPPGFKPSEVDLKFRGRCQHCA
jgi:Fur family transcriptional regulator, ferric uptake regulator